ncbi:hypothetical protein A2U94_17975 [Bacillus sp. VT 712]|jgi:Zn-dependent peptidase ImmA (M78 family)|uniref:IrrE N-terminal-like domain-containing protein n=1 Tax=Priestia veravalensis TaxID=1414648 RepID=A0A0V8JSX2_9BACI|nr:MULTISPECIES: ImmA/IrrE family metallo-endopeptidase [Bacillaceae]KSU89840.1 hypothetical protein AS180_00275 [Priestia veravalensis]KZB90049.1 hypothetical protein A2U94_17975 [Bacillus sp. VT 712]MEC0664516.1 ImmA/IrrE family metallo-endopeptidase [Priestia flexa]QCS52354.1 ImmA/IrrE family metallo-endopeptidase [Priestia flexa]SCB74681.1 protein of unknown function [Priestia flexa]
MNYQFTPLEDSVRYLYQKLHINVPSQIDMISIASNLGIWLHFVDFESAAIDRNGLYSILINRSLSSQQQWEDFGHELGHVLFHCGHQWFLPEGFIAYQENKANNFALQFCVPTFMLLKLSPPPTKREFIHEVSTTFNVTPLFASRRIEHFENQILGITYSQKFREAISSC